MNEHTVTSPSKSVAAIAGVVVTRVLVPLWLLTGVVLALINGNASHLPASLVKWAGPTGIDLVFVLYFGAAVELTVVGIIWGLPRLGRPVAMVLLAIFLPILVGDIALGAASCGCFGAVQVPPWFTLTLDVLLFLGVWLLGGRSPSLRMRPELATWRVLLIGSWAIACFAFSFGLMTHRGGTSAGGVDSGGEGVVVALPDYFLPSFDEWIGLSWPDVPIAPFVIGTPDDLDLGQQYILFFRKDCEHCHEFMEVFFSTVMPAPTTAIAVPEKHGFPTEGLLPLPCTECSLAELPSGCDWFLQTPVLVRLEDGVVACAAEVTAADPQCLVF